MKTRLYMSISDDFNFPRMLEYCCGKLIVTGRTPRISMSVQLKNRIIGMKIRYKGVLTLYLTSPKFLMRYA